MNRLTAGWRHIDKVKHGAPPKAIAGTLAIALGGAVMAGAAVATAKNQAPGPLSATDGILITLDASAANAARIEDGTAASDGISLLSDNDMTEALERAGLTATDAIAAGDGLLVAAKPAQGQSDREALAAAKNLPGAATVQYNYIYHPIEPAEQGAVPQPDGSDSGVDPLATARVNDPFAQVANPDASTANQYWLYTTGILNAWNTATTQHEVSVAVIDTGTNLRHEDLADNIDKKLAYDVTCDTPLADAPVQDATGHGTGVAGVLAATANNAMGLAGASYNANIVPIKVADNSAGATITSASLIEAYDYLLNLVDTGRLSNLRVINMSLGGYENAANDEALHDAIVSAREDYGILTVCAGGNGYIPEGGGSRVPSTEPMFPSDFDECVSVTGLEADGTNIYWSDYNQAKDISAPGRSVWSTSSPGSYSWSSGTSEAAPMVSGTIALMCAAMPDATPEQVLDALYATADPIRDPVYDRTQTSGTHGALDADEALARLIENAQKPTGPEAPAFSDVHEGEWFYGAVQFAAERGIMNGYGDGTFGPEDPLPREQAACVLYNYLGDGEIAPAAPQEDVEQDYYTDAINWAVFHGVIGGYKNNDGTSTTFGVGDGLTREQLASIIANVARKPDDTVDATKYNALSDHDDTSPWAVSNLQWAVDRGVIKGIELEDGSRILMPCAVVDRAQMAAIMMNCIEAGLL